jgi:nucleoside-diphosphate-sugar epimerase
MKKCLVSGTNGFIPSYVVGELHDRGYYVVGLQRSMRTVKGLTKREIPDEIYLGDVRDKALAHKLVEQVDGVIHLAAILGTKHTEDVWPWYENNVLGILNTLDACETFDVPMVYISVGNFFEHNNYSNTKMAAEREVMKYSKYRGVRGGVVRALNAVGPRQKVKNTGKIMATFITQALKDEPITVYGGRDNCSKMDMIYAGDVAKVLVSHLENIASGKTAPATKVEAGTGLAPTVFEIAQMIIKACDSKSEIVEVPMRDGETPGSTVVAENPFPIEYRDLNEVIKETVDFYRVYGE